MNIGSGVVGQLVLEPGWRWSESVKPLAGTEWCEAPHFQYHVSGRIEIIASDGDEFEAGPGEVTSLPSGHDAVVVGDDPVIVVDFFGASHYAVQSAEDVAASAATGARLGGDEIELKYPQAKSKLRRRPTLAMTRCWLTGAGRRRLCQCCRPALAGRCGYGG